MPNIVAHYVCGVLVAKKLRIKDREYLRGNLYPDYVDKTKHYRMQGRMFEIPDLDMFMKEENIDNYMFKLGFLTHLMLDKLFLEKYVIDYIYSKINKKENIFVPDKIYRDYTNISRLLLKHYGLSLEDIDSLMLASIENFDLHKYMANIDVIRQTNSQELRYLDLNSFINFIDDSAEKIYTYIKKKNYY